MKVVETVRLMGGDLLIQRFDDRPSYQARLYDRSKRRYITRSLRTTDIGTATDRAIALWRDLSPLIESHIPINAGSLEQVVADYLQAEAKRVAAGEIKPGAVRDKAAQLKVVLLYCRIHGLKLVTDVRSHSFNDFTAWRRDESKQLTTGQAGVMRRASLNKAIRELRAWWKWVRQRHLSEVSLEIREVTTRKEEPREKNVAFLPEHVKQIDAELHRWAILQQQAPAHVNKRMRPIHWYGRALFRNLIAVLEGTGVRPQEATDIICWKDCKFRNEGATESARFLDPVVVIQIRNDDGKGSRSVASNTGWILKCWKKESNKWRKLHGYPQIKGDDLLFAYPPTNTAYAYSHFSRTFRDLLKRIRLDGLGYTLRSYRATYITNQLAKGRSPYLIARNTGHSLEILKRHYEQLSESQLIQEMTS